MDPIRTDDPQSHGKQEDDWRPQSDVQMPPLPEPDEDTRDDSTEFPEDRPPPPVLEEPTHVYRHVACGGDAFYLANPSFAGVVAPAPVFCTHCGAQLLPKNMAWRHVHPLLEHDQRPASG